MHELMEVFKEIYPSSFLAKYLEQEIRTGFSFFSFFKAFGFLVLFFYVLIADGRALFEFRDTSVAKGNLGTCLGSSFVKIGSTKVICGIKGEIEPQNESELLKITVEMSSVAHGDLKGVHSHADGLFIKQKLSSLLQDVVDRSQLTLEKDKKKWCLYLYVDVYCLDDDGNVFDAASKSFQLCLLKPHVFFFALVLSSVAALSNVKLPTLSYNERTKQFVQSQNENGDILRLGDLPFAASFALFEKWIIADPTHEEEDVCGALFHVVLDTKGKLCAMEKRGGQIMDKAQMEQCLRVAEQRVQKMKI